MLKDIKHRDGVTIVSVRRLKRRIRASDGSFRSMVSLDGETWVLEASERKEHRRLTAASNLLGPAWVEAKKKAFDARVNPGVPEDPNPDVHQLINHVGITRYGKKGGKQQKYKRNLRRKKERNVKIMKAVHFHVCPGENHPHRRRRFSCSCERPEARHVTCGTTQCLYERQVML